MAIPIAIPWVKRRNSVHVFRAADLLRFDVGVPLLGDLCMQNATCSEDELVEIAIFILEDGVRIFFAFKYC